MIDSILLIVKINTFPNLGFVFVPSLLCVGFITYLYANIVCVMISHCKLASKEEPSGWLINSKVSFFCSLCLVTLPVTLT